MAKIKAKQKLRLKEKKRIEKEEKEKKEAEEAIEVDIGENEFDLEQRMTPPPSPPIHSQTVSSPLILSPMIPCPTTTQVSPPPSQTVVFDSTSMDDGSTKPTDEVPCLIQGFKNR